MSEILPRTTLYAHGTMGLPLAVIGYPLAIWIPAHYSGGLGISLAAVGTILMLARLTDVITDPIIGELSDRWRTPIGRLSTKAEPTTSPAPWPSSNSTQVPSDSHPSMRESTSWN